MAAPENKNAFAQARANYEMAKADWAEVTPFRPQMREGADAD